MYLLSKLLIDMFLSVFLNLFIHRLLFVVVVVYIMNQIAFFHDKEFERAVRDTLESPYMSFTTKRKKPIF